MGHIRSRNDRRMNPCLHVGRRPGDALARRPAGGTTIGEAINGGFDLLEAKCNRCDRVSLVPLGGLRHPPETPVWKLERALYCESCSEGRHYSRRQRAHVLGLTYARPEPEPIWAPARSEKSMGSFPSQAPARAISTAKFGFCICLQCGRSQGGLAVTRRPRSDTGRYFPAARLDRHSGTRPALQAPAMPRQRHFAAGPARDDAAPSRSSG